MTKHSKPMRNFLKATSEKARIGKCCQILIRELCGNCEHAKLEKVLLVRTIRTPDIDKRVCMNCVALMYKTAYGEDLKNWEKGCTK